MPPPKTHTIPTVTEAEAARLAGSARDAAAESDIAIAVAVVDASGRLMHFRRMDGASPITVEVAIAKARTAVLLAAPSRLFEDRINTGETAMSGTPAVTPLRGGLPLVQEGLVCGAVGVSGSTGDQDERLAAEAVATFDLA